MKDLYPVKKIMAEAISAVFKEAGLKHDDDFRNWILSSDIIMQLLNQIQDTAIDIELRYQRFGRKKTDK